MGREVGDSNDRPSKHSVSVFAPLYFLHIAVCFEPVVVPQVAAGRSRLRGAYKILRTLGTATASPAEDVVHRDRSCAEKDQDEG